MFPHDTSLKPDKDFNILNFEFSNAESPLLCDQSPTGCLMPAIMLDFRLGGSNLPDLSKIDEESNRIQLPTTAEKQINKISNKSTRPVFSHVQSSSKFNLTLRSFQWSTHFSSPGSPTMRAMATGCSGAQPVARMASLMWRVDECRFSIFQMGGIAIWSYFTNLENLEIAGRFS